MCSPSHRLHSKGTQQFQDQWQEYLLRTSPLGLDRNHPSGQGHQVSAEAQHDYLITASLALRHKFGQSVGVLSAQ